MAREPIHAGGGIVLRGGARPRIAVVRRRKDDRWVLPRGKLKRDEDPLAGARREVVEETGHRVQVHEFLGAITYMARGRPKVVQFWRMQAAERPSHDLMPDIKEVDWLPIGAAIRRLSFPLEKLFLRHVARRAFRRRHRKVRGKVAQPRRRGAAPARTSSKVRPRKPHADTAQLRRPRSAKSKGAKSKGAKSKRAKSKRAKSKGLRTKRAMTSRTKSRRTKSRSTKARSAARAVITQAIVAPAHAVPPATPMTVPRRPHPQRAASNIFRRILGRL